MCTPLNNICPVPLLYSLEIILLSKFKNLNLLDSTCDIVYTCLSDLSDLSPTHGD